MSSEFKKIQEAADLVDITFSCDGKQFGAHKLVLFACSPYFKEILKVENLSLSFIGVLNTHLNLNTTFKLIEKSMFTSCVFYKWC